MKDAGSNPARGISVFSGQCEVDRELPPQAVLWGPLTSIAVWTNKVGTGLPPPVRWQKDGPSHGRWDRVYIAE